MNKKRDLFSLPFPLLLPIVYLRALAPLIALSFGITAVWLVITGFTSAGHLALNDAGRPYSLQMQTKEFIQGRDFWEEQLQLIDSRVDRLRSFDRRKGEGKRLLLEMERKEKLADREMCKEFDELCPSLAEQKAEQLKQQASWEEWEHQKRTDRIAAEAEVRRLLILKEKVINHIEQ